MRVETNIGLAVGVGVVRVPRAVPATSSTVRVFGVILRGYDALPAPWEVLDGRARALLLRVVAKVLIFVTARELWRSVRVGYPAHASTSSRALTKRSFSVELRAVMRMNRSLRPGNVAGRTANARARRPATTAGPLPTSMRLKLALPGQTRMRGTRRRRLTRSCRSCRARATASLNPVGCFAAATRAASARAFVDHGGCAARELLCKAEGGDGVPHP